MKKRTKQAYNLVYIQLRSPPPMIPPSLAPSVPAICAPSIGIGIHYSLSSSPPIEPSHP